MRTNLIEKFHNIKNNVAKLSEVNLKNRIDFASKEVEQLVDFAKDRIKKLEENREKEYTEAEAKREKQLQLLLKKIDSDFSKKTDELEGLRQKADQLVGTAASRSMAKEYAKNAKRERWMTWLWELITVLAFGTLVTFSVIEFNSSLQKGELTWQMLGLRIAVASTFAILGTYAASRANKRQKIEVINRQMSMELNAIDLYLNDLPEENRVRLKEQLVDKFFGRQDLFNDRDCHPIPQVEMD